jgi:ribosome-associated translation inhibitor RaiA
LFGAHYSDLTKLPTNSYFAVIQTIQSILESRREFANRCNIVFSGTYETARKSSKNVLQQAGIPLEDPAGWLARSRAKCGATFLAYSQARDADVDDLLHKLEQQLNDYKKRVESIESYVYMQCVGIQLEKHFSKKRAEALAGTCVLLSCTSSCGQHIAYFSFLLLAFEKKTDIQTAINLALKKRLPLLVQELETKLQAVDAVTHTTVKESKEAHLLSKSLKSEIGDLALRRFQRSKESALNAVVSLMTSWATCK